MTLISLLKKKHILKFGTFTLRSGEVSHYYCDIKEAMGDPVILRMMMKELVRLVPVNVTCIAGSGYGGISLATLVAYQRRLPLVLVRDRVKDHGTKKSIDGYMPGRKDVVCIIDDVFTTGSSIRDTKEKLKANRVKYSKSVVVLNRSIQTRHKKEVLSLIDGADIVFG